MKIKEDKEIVINYDNLIFLKKALKRCDRPVLNTFYTYYTDSWEIHTSISECALIFLFARKLEYSYRISWWKRRVALKLCKILPKNVARKKKRFVGSEMAILQVVANKSVKITNKL